jgi:LysM repeat protein
MKYIKPHLSPELRAQITPANRRDRRLATAGVVFLIFSVVLVINLIPKSDNSGPKIDLNQPLSQSTGNKVVLGVSTTAEDTTEDQPVDTQTVTPPPAQQTQTEQPATNTDDFTSYTVKAGDTLFNISQEYNIKWDLIAQINSLTEPYVLHAGDTLKIPQSTTSAIPNKVYTIKSGETLSSIAKSFNITVADIIAVNPNLQKSDLITPGQIIKLP